MTSIPAVATDGSHITLRSADVGGLRSALRGGARRLRASHATRIFV